MKQELRVVWHAEEEQASATQDLTHQNFDAMLHHVVVQVWIIRQGDPLCACTPRCFCFCLDFHSLVVVGELDLEEDRRCSFRCNKDLFGC